MPRRLVAGAMAASLTTVAACANDTPTYHRDIAPMVRAQCGGCHSPGGIGPFPLDTYEALEEAAPLSLQSMREGTMPPWMPDPSCRTFQDERLLTGEEIDRFQAWVDGGMPEGDPASDPGGDDPVTPFEPTHTASVPGGYLPDETQLDDYRCFVLDFGLTEDMFMRGSNVVPGSRSLVHHVLVYAVGPDAAADVAALDAADDGPGYTCFGGPLPSDPDDAEATSRTLPTQLGAWVPGHTPSVYPEDSAIAIEAGSLVIMQVHYNLVSEDPKQDATELQLILDTTEPAYTIDTRPLPILDLDIRAGDPSSVHERLFRNYNSEPLTITALAGHMHLLGRRISAELVRDGSEECVLDIPHWDFNWQQSYRLPADEPLLVQPLEAIRLTCEYDNSAENQPVVNGVQREPTHVSWGEGTYDEMCLLYIALRDPYVPGLHTSEGCGESVASCMETCEGNEAACLIGCEDMSSSCRSCMVSELVDCTRYACAVPLLNAADCLRPCVVNTYLLGGDIDRCLQTECPAQRDPLVECIEPLLASGSCDVRLSACGIER